jgi:hypothetical protein
MAIDIFHTQIDSKEIGVEDLVLRLGIKLSSGVVTGIITSQAMVRYCW